MSTEVSTSTGWMAQERSTRMQPFRLPLAEYCRQKVEQEDTPVPDENRYGRAENRTWPMGKAYPAQPRVQRLVDATRESGAHLEVRPVQRKKKAVTMRLALKLVIEWNSRKPKGIMMRQEPAGIRHRGISMRSEAAKSYVRCNTLSNP